MTEDELLFSDDELPPSADVTTAQPWNILIIDDDDEVHQATRLALSDTTFLGRPMRFLSAHSGEAARRILPSLHDIAIILLDVVMETDDAGLQLVHYIRETLGWAETRIILRTGQPGSAPEREVIVRYDINDYKAKAELTEARLFTSIIAALRSYRDLVHLVESRVGLRKVIDAAASLHQSRSMQLFADGVLLQLTAILQSDSHSILCSHRRIGDAGKVTLLASSGRFAELPRGTPSHELDEVVERRIAAALAGRSSVFGADHAALYMATPNQREVVVYIENLRPFSELDLSLLELFGHNISIGYDNLKMFQELVEAKESLEVRVTERTHELSRSEMHLRRFKAAVDHSSASILITDPEGVIEYVNPALSRTSQYAPEELLGRQPSLFKSGMVSPEIFQALWSDIAAGRDWRGELLNRRKNGETYWEDVSISPVSDATGAITHFVAVKDDISNRKAMENELRSLATIDPLTGVLNRRSFFELAEQELSRCRRHPRPLSALMLDIDLFKLVNDRYGHQTGDDVLRAVVAACLTSLRDRDIIGRLGGEEFACILPDTTIEQAMIAAERLRVAVSGRAVGRADGQPITVTVSVGVASLRDTDGGVETVLNRADAALYAAKQAGRNVVRREE